MIKWNQNLSIGIEKVDNQHKKLFEIVDQLTTACNERRGKEEVGNVLNFLQSYVIEHFRDEENFMLKNNYPAYKQHKQIHDDFTKKIEEISNKYKNEGVSLTILISTNKMVFDWLRSHILEMDKAIGAHIMSTK